MGPSSKTAVVEVLGALLEESRGLRATLMRIERGLEARDRLIGADLDQVNGRVSAIEATLRGHGIEPAPTPAE